MVHLQHVQLTGRIYLKQTSHDYANNFHWDLSLWLGRKLINQITYSLSSCLLFMIYTMRRSTLQHVSNFFERRSILLKINISRLHIRKYIITEL